MLEKKSRYIAAAALLVVFSIFLLGTFCSSTGYPQTMHVAVMACKVRSGAGTEFDLVGWLTEDETVTVLGVAEDKNNQTWYKIDKKCIADSPEAAEAEECYVRSDLLMAD